MVKPEPSEIAVLLREQNDLLRRIVTFLESGGWHSAGNAAGPDLDDSPNIIHVLGPDDLGYRL